MAKILAKNLFDYLDGLGDLPQNSVFRVLLISIHAPREGCDSKLYQRAGSLLGSICLFAQGEEG